MAELFNTRTTAIGRCLGVPVLQQLFNIDLEKKCTVLTRFRISSLANRRNGEFDQCACFCMEKKWSIFFSLRTLIIFKSLKRIHRNCPYFYHSTKLIKIYLNCIFSFLFSSRHMKNQYRHINNRNTLKIP